MLRETIQRQSPGPETCAQLVLRLVLKTVPRPPLTLLWMATTLAAQESRPASAPLADEARAALHTLALGNAKAKVLRADYVQQRTTALRKKPLESKGTLFFRAEPACIVFAVAEPKPARIRLDARSYEVLRQDQNQLERFVLASSDLPNALFESLRADWEKLLLRLDFAGATLGDAGKTLRIRFVPKDASVRPFLTELELAIAVDGSVIRAVGYVDGQGDRITITLANLAIDPRLETEPFDVPIPVGTAILQHAVEPPPPKK